MSSQTVEDIMTDAFSGKITQAQASELIKKLMDEKKPITFKVSEKGCISFYGIRKMPISLYKSELDKILDVIKTPEFEQFLEDNESVLSEDVSKKSHKKVAIIPN